MGNDGDRPGAAQVSAQPGEGVEVRLYLQLPTRREVPSSAHALAEASHAAELRPGTPGEGVLSLLRHSDGRYAPGPFATLFSLIGYR
jgi:hypothetical protein